jgi:hypothetical protein
MTVNGMFSLLEAAAHFRTFGANVEIAKQATLAEIAIMIRDEAKSAIGTYRYRWPELADATKEDRAKKGFSEDEPGLRTGEMRDSIEAKILADEEKAYVGSNDDKLVWFELGTKSQPPRSILLSAALQKERQAVNIAKRNIRTAWTSAVAGHNDLAQLLHALRLLLEVAHEIKKIGKHLTK